MWGPLWNMATFSVIATSGIALPQCFGAIMDLPCSGFPACLLHFIILKPSAVQPKRHHGLYTVWMGFPKPVAMQHRTPPHSLMLWGDPAFTLGRLALVRVLSRPCRHRRPWRHQGLCGFHHVWSQPSPVFLILCRMTKSNLCLSVCLSLSNLCLSQHLHGNIHEIHCRSSKGWSCAGLLSLGCLFPPGGVCHVWGCWWGVVGRQSLDQSGKASVFYNISDVLWESILIWLAVWLGCSFIFYSLCVYIVLSVWFK